MESKALLALERRFRRHAGAMLALERRFGRPDGAKLALERRCGRPGGAKSALEWRLRPTRGIQDSKFSPEIDDFQSICPNRLEIENRQLYSHHHNQLLNSQLPLKK